MRLLVSGASGFIGRAVCRAAIERGHHVTTVSSSGTPVPGIATMLPYHGLAAHDLTQYDALIHLAWKGVVNYKDPQNMADNLEAQTAFVVSALESGIRDLVVAGTCLEYGLVEGCVAEGVSVDPVVPYAVAKSTLHSRLRALLDERYSKSRLNWLRYFYVYGLEQRPTALVPQLARAIAEGNSRIDMTPGDQVRDFVSVGAIAWNTVIATENMHVNDAINVGSGQGRRVADFARDVVRQLDGDIEFNLGALPYPAHEPREFFANTERLRSLTEARIDDATVL